MLKNNEAAPYIQQQEPERHSVQCLSPPYHMLIVEQYACWPRPSKI